MRGLKLKIWLVSVILLFTQAVFSNVPSYSEISPQTALRWKKRIIPIEISGSLQKYSSAIRADSDIKGALSRSFAAWENVAEVEFQILWSERQSANLIGRSGDGINLITIAPTAENLQFFNNESTDSPARTRVFFNRQGTILESDIVLNPFQQFSTDGSFGTFDLEATLTHEIGHLLGLDHSPVLGATMYEYQPKNGVFGLMGFSQRTLSDDDSAKIKTRYLSKDSGQNCCGKLSGKILLPNNKPAKDFVVWLQETDTGRVSTATWTDFEGNYEFGGIEKSNYRIFVQGRMEGANVETNFFAEELGQIDFSPDKANKSDWRIATYQKEITVEYLGFNGQFSKTPVTLNPGKNFQMFLGGRFDERSAFFLSAGTDELSIKTDGSASTVGDFEIDNIGFYAQLKEEIKLGEYSVMIEDKKGNRKFLVGCLTVEKFNNPWKVYNLK